MFQPSLMFVGKSRTKFKNLARTNSLAYFVASISVEECSTELMTFVHVIKVFYTNNTIILITYIAEE